MGELGDTIGPPYLHQVERRSPGGHLLAQDSKVTSLLSEGPQYWMRR